MPPDQHLQSNNLNPSPTTTGMAHLQIVPIPRPSKPKLMNS